jgi:hypothetical protein
MLLNLPTMKSSRRTLPVANLAVGGFAILTLACGSQSGLGGSGGQSGTGGAAGAGQTGGINGGGGGTGQGGSKSQGGAPGTGGAATGGTLGTGGSTAKGGASGTGGILGAGGGTGGAAADAGVACTDDAGSALPAAARRCIHDSDCTIAVAQRCCGLDQAIGEATSQSGTYAACLALPPGACQGLGCAKMLGYSTDTGKTTPVEVSSGNPLDWVTVHCLDQICTTDVLATQDGGRDAQTADAPVDAAVTPPGDGGSSVCGSSVCTATQLCVRPSCAGGTAPPCVAIGEAGACPTGYTFSSFCQYATGGGAGPGCLPPPCVSPPPFCLDTPAACDAKLTCGCLPATVCGTGGGGCMMISASVVQCGAA